MRALATALRARTRPPLRRFYGPRAGHRALAGPARRDRVEHSGPAAGRGRLSAHGGGRGRRCQMPRPPRARVARAVRLLHVTARSCSQDRRNFVRRHVDSDRRRRRLGRAQLRRARRPDGRGAQGAISGRQTEVAGRRLRAAGRLASLVDAGARGRGAEGDRRAPPGRARPRRDAFRLAELGDASGARMPYNVIKGSGLALPNTAINLLRWRAPGGRCSCGASAASLASARCGAWAGSPSWALHSRWARRSRCSCGARSLVI